MGKRRLEELGRALPWSVALLLIQILVSWMLFIRTEAIVFDAYLSIIVPLSVIAHLILSVTYIMRSDRMLTLSLLVLFHLGVVLQASLLDVSAFEKAYGTEQAVNVGILHSIRTLLTNNVIVIVGALVCTLAFFSLYRYMDIQLLQRLIFVAVIGMFLALVLFGTGVHGVKAWLILGGFQFQVTELIKIAVLLYLCLLYADELCTTGQKLIRAGCFLAGISVGFVIINELGTVIIIWLVAFILTFIALKPSDFLLLAGALFAVVLMGILVITKLNLAYVAGQKNAMTTLGFEIFQKVYHRFQLVYDLDALDPYGTAYQAVIARKAIWLGGFWGNPDSSLKIPVAESEYIIVYACLKYGLVLVLFISLLYIGCLLRGNRIAERQKDNSLRYIGIACAYSLGIQSLLTILGTCGLIPLSGLPVAFLSDGFSMQLCSFISMFMLIYTGSMRVAAYGTNSGRNSGRRPLGWVQRRIPFIARF